MKDFVKLKERLIFKLTLLERPLIYHNGKMAMCQPFANAKKYHLSEFTARDMASIAVNLNKAFPDGKEIYVLIANGDVWKKVTGEDISIKCLVL